jgi:ribonuclease-3
MARRAGKREVAEDPEAEAIEGLERLLGHTFKRPELLTLALTHRSYVYDRAASGLTGDLADPSQDNEQLEFMGDAALGLLAAEALCRRFPGSREGELTKLRASVVSRRHLGEVGTRMGLGRWLRLGHTAEKNAGRTNAALFANAVEALIAALYLDGGLEAARRFVEEEVLAGALPERVTAEGERVSGAVGDHKSALQELLQASGMGRPLYHLLGESGPDHRRVFRVEVRLDGNKGDPGALAEAEGSTKKRAQQEAARLAFVKLAHLKAANGAEVAHG